MPAIGPRWFRTTVWSLLTIVSIPPLRAVDAVTPSADVASWLLEELVDKVDPSTLCDCGAAGENTPRPAQAGLPDLVVQIASATPYVTTETFSPSSCAVQEGFITPGTHRLLRFTTETLNIGAADLFVGDPSTNPLFHFAPCHGHYHFEEYAEYTLLDASGEVAAGHKAGFCLLDTFRHDPSANPNAVYNCSNQGIQAGWGDRYNSTLTGQWVAITDVPDGLYTLVLEVNPEHLLAESDTSNNAASMEIVIAGGGGGGNAPPNDLCENALTLCPGIVAGTTLDALTDGAVNCAEGLVQTSHDVWFSYTPGSGGVMTASTCGSQFDTVLSVHSGCPGTVETLLACNDDSNACGSGSSRSHLTLPVSGGVTYLIRVAGYADASGPFSLALTGPECSPEAQVPGTGIELSGLAVSQP